MDFVFSVSMHGEQAALRMTEADVSDGKEKYQKIRHMTSVYSKAERSTIATFPPATTSVPVILSAGC